MGGRPDGDDGGWFVLAQCTAAPPHPAATPSPPAAPSAPAPTGPTVAPVTAADDELSMADDNMWAYDCRGIPGSGH